MRYLLLCVVVAIVLLLSASFSQASLLHQDTAYWYRDGDQIITQLNPSTEWLNQMIPTGRVILNIQQSIYDQVSTMSILRRNGNLTSYSGYLYAYSVTNLCAGGLDEVNDIGITSFAVDWAPEPVFVTASRQIMPNWTVDDSHFKPAWKWAGSLSPGIRPGETVGGYWAVSSVLYNSDIWASAACISALGQETLTGKIVSVPEPATLVALVAGLMGLGFTRRPRVR